MINILISVIKSDISKLNIPKYKSNNLNIVINTVKNIFNINDTLYALYVINNLLISVKSLLSIVISASVSFLEIAQDKNASLNNFLSFR